MRLLHPRPPLQQGCKEKLPIGNEMVVTRMLVNCSIENLSITGSFENKEHYQEYASILMTWDVGG